MLEITEAPSWGDLRYVRALSALSAARQWLPAVRIPGIDARSPNFRVTRWRSTAQSSVSLAWKHVEPVIPGQGERSGSWPDADVVLLGMNLREWRSRASHRWRLAGAYAIGTAVMMGDVVEDHQVGISPIPEDPKGGYIAMRISDEPTDVLLGVRSVSLRQFCPADPADIRVVGPFPQAELADRYPNAVLL